MRMVNVNAKQGVPDNEYSDYKQFSLTYGDAVKYACRVFGADIKSRISNWGRITFTSQAGEVVLTPVRFGYDVALKEPLIVVPEVQP